LPITVRGGFYPVRGGAVVLVEGSGYRQRPGGCASIAPGGGGPARVVVEVPSGGLSYDVTATARPELKLRRFAEGFAVVPELPQGPARVAIPTDRSRRPWQAEVVTASRLELCP
jgi:hypothetical protein